MPPKKHRRGLQPRAKQSQQYECNLETASAELVEIKVLAGKPDELGDLMNATLLVLICRSSHLALLTLLPEDAHSARNTGASTLDILGSQGGTHFLCAHSQPHVFTKQINYETPVIVSTALT